MMTATYELCRYVSPDSAEAIRNACRCMAERTGGSPLLAAAQRKLPGGGTEVTGHRDYSPGDDFHAIDWTLCASRDELYVKLFEGQSDRDVHLLVDCSPSMGLGRPAKFQVARQIAAGSGLCEPARVSIGWSWRRLPMG